MHERTLAQANFEAGEYRAALHIWDSLEHPEQMTDAEVTMFETARREVQGP